MLGIETPNQKKLMKALRTTLLLFSSAFMVSVLPAEDETSPEPLSESETTQRARPTIEQRERPRLRTQEEYDARYRDVDEAELLPKEQPLRASVAYADENGFLHVTGNVPLSPWYNYGYYYGWDYPYHGCGPYLPYTGMAYYGYYDPFFYDPWLYGGAYRRGVYGYPYPALNDDVPVISRSEWDDLDIGMQADQSKLKIHTDYSYSILIADPYYGNYGRCYDPRWVDVGVDLMYDLRGISFGFTPSIRFKGKSEKDPRFE